MDDGGPEARRGTLGQGAHRRGVAGPGGVLPRRRGLHALPRTVQAADGPEGELHGDVQCLGGLLRPAERPGRQGDAADAGLRRVLRVRAARRAGTASTGGCAAVGGGAGAELRDGHFDLVRPVALPDWRHGALQLGETLQVRHQRPHQELHQRLRRGADCGQCRTGPAGGLPADGSCGKRVYGRTGVYGRRGPLPTPMGGRVRSAAGRHGGLRRTARQGTAGGQLGL